MDVSDSGAAQQKEDETHGANGSDGPSSPPAENSASNQDDAQRSLPLREKLHAAVKKCRTKKIGKIASLQKSRRTHINRSLTLWKIRKLEVNSRKAESEKLRFMLALKYDIEKNPDVNQEGDTKILEELNKDIECLSARVPQYYLSRIKNDFATKHYEKELLKELAQTD